MHAQTVTTPVGRGRKDDPFYWSPERLLTELCTSDRSWEAPPPRKWPDPDKLAEKLRMHDLDGQDLITLQDVAGSGSFDLLCRDLDIVKIPHKMSLYGAIQVFQFRSPAYRAWKEARAAQSQMVFEPEESSEPGAEDAPVPAAVFTTPKRGKPAYALTVTPRRKTATANDVPRGVVLQGDVPQSDPGASSPNGHMPPLSPTGPSPLFNKKRKRIAPTNISAAPLSRPDKTTEPTTETSFLAATNGLELVWKTSTEGAFLGPAKLTEHDLLHAHDPLDPEAQDNDGSEDDADFIWVAHKTIPAGRRLQVHQTIRRFLRPRKPTLHLGRGHPNPQDTGANEAAGDDGDVVLPLLGESDDDEEYDTETWEAMLQEEKERNNPQPRKNAPLSTEVIDAVVADAIREMEAKWTAKKLPALRKREHALWMAARRSGSRMWMASTSRIRAEALGRRIEKLVEEIRSGEYKSERELRLLTPTLEQSVADKRRAMWEARLYARPTEPPKLRAARRRESLPVRAVQADNDGTDVEILTSSSDEDMRGFITDDDAALPGASDAENMFVPAPSWSPDPMEVDAANSVSPPPQTQETGGGDDTNATATAPQKLVRSDKPAASAGALSKADAPNRQLVAEEKQVLQTTADIKQLLLDSFRSHDKDQLCRLFSVPSLDLHDDAVSRGYIDSAMSATATITDDAVAFSRLFYVFLTCRAIPVEEFFPVDAAKGQLLLENHVRILGFRILARILLPQVGLPFQKTALPDKPKGTNARSSQSKATSRRATSSESDDHNNSDTWAAGDSSSDIEVLAVRPVQRNESDFEDDDVPSPPRRPKKRFIRRDQDAQELRDKDRERLEEQENRRKALYKKLADSTTISRDQSRLIINTAKEDHHGLVYINRTIGEQIRDHQIEGVRFMWNQLIVAPNVRQGCLLAHTMGLGKTMQVISLLVSMAEAAASPDETVASQIPEDLRAPKILILCPSGLVQNWLDELLRWTPDNLLGRYYFVSADLDPTERISTVERWADSERGVLVVGYTMFRRLIDDFGDEIQPLLEKSPDIVIADEAHALKNPKSKVHEATANFSTKARIAMTGSPLANAVEEYHSMINWVAPNYLADHREFVSIYANPIKQGFYKDSTAYQRRRAIKMLKVLKDTVAPKIHRATVASLKGELPPKTEFILYMPLTELQLNVYRTFISSVNKPSFINEINTTVKLWNILVNLTLLLAHPKVFRIRLKEMHAALLRTMQSGPRSAADRAKKRESILPPETIRDLLAAVQRRDIDNTEHSSKIVVLMGILDEAKRIGDKVLVFSQSKLVLDYLEDMFKRQKRRYSRLDGDTAISLRQTLVNNFNTGNDEIYLISTTAGGVGLNIQGANRVVIFDFKWNPIHEQQAVGRAYRIGQTKPVFVYWLVTGGTCETVLHNQAVFKTQLASRVVDKKNPSAWAKQIRDYTKEPTVMEQDETIPERFGGRDRVLDALLQDDVRKRCICKIVSTDTFEEEEPEDKLSPEELKETAALVFQNKAGIWTAADAAKAGVTFVSPSLPAVSVGLAPTMARPLATGPGMPAVPTRPAVPATGTAAMPARPAVPATGTAAMPARPTAPVPGMAPVLTRPTVPGPGSAAVPTRPTLPPLGPWLVAPPGAVPSTNVQYAPNGPFQPHPPPPPMQIPQAHYGLSYNPGGKTDVASRGQMFDFRAPSPHFAAHAQPSAESSTLLATPDDLKSVLIGTLVARKVDVGTAHEHVSQAVASIASNFRQTGVPASAQWARLRNRALADAIFAGAMVTGRLRPEFLAVMSIPEEEEAVRQLHASDSANNASADTSRQSSVDAKPAAPMRVKDPDHVSAHIQRARDRMAAQAAASASHNSRDLWALEAVEAQRKKKLQQQHQHQHQQSQARPPPPASPAQGAAALPPALPSPATAHARLPQWTTSQAGDLPKPKIKPRIRPPPGARSVGPPPVGPPVGPPATGPLPAEKRIGSNPQEPYILD